MEAVYPGAAIGAAEQARLERLSEARAAVRSALGLLARAPHSRQGLRLKLVQRGHKDEAISAALDRASELGYLDDARFAEDWIRFRIERHPEGRSALVAGLRERGVPRDVAEAVGARVITDEVEEDCLLRAIGRAGRARGVGRADPSVGRADPSATLRSSAAETTRLAARLRSLGFPNRLVRKHLPETDRAF